MAIKKLSLKMLMKDIPEQEVIDLTLNGDAFNDVTIRIRKTLDLKHAMQFVSDVVNTCVDEDTGEYMPEYVDFVRKMYVLKYYGNIDMPKDVSKAYWILHNTDLYPCVFNRIDQEQYYELALAIDKQIAFRRDILISTASRKVVELLSKVEEIIGDSLDIMSKFDAEDLKSAMSEIADMGSLLAGKMNDGEDVLDDLADEEDADEPSIEKDDVEREDEPQTEASNVMYIKKHRKKNNDA